MIKIVIRANPFKRICTTKQEKLIQPQIGEIFLINWKKNSKLNIKTKHLICNKNVYFKFFKNFYNSLVSLFLNL